MKRYESHMDVHTGNSIKITKGGNNFISDNKKIGRLY